MYVCMYVLLYVCVYIYIYMNIYIYIYRERERVCKLQRLRMGPTAERRRRAGCGAGGGAQRKSPKRYVGYVVVTQITNEHHQRNLWAQRKSPTNNYVASNTTCKTLQGGALFRIRLFADPPLGDSEGLYTDIYIYIYIYIYTERERYRYTILMCMYVYIYMCICI